MRQVKIQCSAPKFTALLQYSVIYVAVLACMQLCCVPLHLNWTELWNILTEVMANPIFGCNRRSFITRQRTPISNVQRCGVLGSISFWDSRLLTKSNKLVLWTFKALIFFDFITNIRCWELRVLCMFSIRFFITKGGSAASGGAFLWCELWCVSGTPWGYKSCLSFPHSTEI